MIVVHGSDFAGTRQELEGAVAAFQAEIAAHALTVGIPAPVADLPIVGRIIAEGDGFVLASEIEPEVEAPKTERDAILARLAALDREVPRVLEDVISALGVALPQAAAVKVARKAELREMLKGVA